MIEAALKALAGETVTDGERRRIATSDPENRAWLTMQLAEQRLGRRVSPDELRRLAAEQHAFGDALAALASDRERSADAGRLVPWSLAEMVPEEEPPTGPSSSSGVLGGRR